MSENIHKNKEQQAEEEKLSEIANGTNYITEPNDPIEESTNNSEK